MKATTKNSIAGVVTLIGAVLLMLVLRRCAP